MITDNQLIEKFSSCNTFEEAFAIFKENQRQIVDFAGVLRGMAKAFEEKGDKQKLEYVYKRIGDIYQQMAEFDAAIEWYEKSKSIRDSSV